ncbi:hypothetical protein QU38_01670, partial [Staphylococcus aureus]
PAGRQGDLDARARGQGRAGRGRARPLLPQPGRRRRRPGAVPRPERRGDRRRSGLALEGPSVAVGLRPAVRRQGPVPGSDVLHSGEAHHAPAAGPVRRRRGVRAGACPLNIEAIMKTAPVIPVLVIEDAATARPLAEALVKGGLRVLEV